MGQICYKTCYLVQTICGKICNSSEKRVIFAVRNTSDMKIDFDFVMVLPTIGYQYLLVLPHIEVSRMRIRDGCTVNVRAGWLIFYVDIYIET